MARRLKTPKYFVDVASESISSSRGIVYYLEQGGHRYGTKLFLMMLHTKVYYAGILQ